MCVCVWGGVLEGPLYIHVLVLSKEDLNAPKLLPMHDHPCGLLKGEGKVISQN